MAAAKATAICPALRDFPSDLTPLGVETAGVAELRGGFPKSENAGRDRKMPFMDGHYLTESKAKDVRERVKPVFKIPRPYISDAADRSGSNCARPI